MPAIADPQKEVAEAVVHGPINEPNQLIDKPDSGATNNPVKPPHNKIAVWLSSPATTRATAVKIIPMDVSKDRVPGDNHMLMMTLANLEPAIQHQNTNGMSVASLFDIAKYFVA